MRQIINTFLIILGVNGWVFSQSTQLELNQPLTGDLQIEALTNITLKPGFSTNGYTFSASINESGYQALAYEAGVPSGEQNYIHTISPRKPVSDLTAVNFSNQSEVMEQIQYFDGLGRPLQDIGVNASPNGKDLVKHTLYDDLGRISQDYSAFTTANTNPGAYVNNLFNSNGTPNNISDYLNCMFQINPSMEATAYPYSHTIYDGSPLNRIMKQGAPGADWQPLGVPERQSTEHVVSYEYGTNTTSEIIYDLAVTSSGTLFKQGISSNGSYQIIEYAPGSLYVTTTTDENGNKVKEYKDKQGKVILKSAYDGSQWLKTYYVYDDFGLLRYVIPPMAQSGLDSWPVPASGSITSASWLNDYCYYYEYDGRKRMIAKKLPGAEMVRMIYDTRDRLVMSQDGKQKTNWEWSVTLFDDLNRPVITGISQLIDFSYQYDLHLIVDYSNFQVAWNSSSNDYSIPTTFGGCTILTKTYYDSYTYSGKLTFVQASCIGKYNDGSGYETALKGMVTGTKTRVLGTNDKWIIETPYYDEYGRVIFSQRIAWFDDSSYSIEIISTLYNFTGEPKQIYQKQTMYPSGGSAQITETNKFLEYDHVGRLIKEEMQVIGGTRETLAEYFYNELGQLQEKQIANGLQTLNYKYNERGWLTRLNDPENTGDDLFAMQLMYQKEEGAIGGISTYYSPYENQFNGNIAAAAFVVPGYTQLGYCFNYDAVNRLTDAVSIENQGSYWATGGDYTTNYSYDANGNILSLGRNRPTNDNIDNLAYNYSGNQLIGVADNATGTKSMGFNDGLTGDASATGAWEYTYDKNGNLIKDLNKGLPSISYNHLNLPKEIITNNGIIWYTYGATGEKLSKKIDLATEGRFYFSNFEYHEMGNLMYIHTSEGRIRVAGSNYYYDYYLKDHLGNTRVVFTDENNDNTPEVLQVDNYYPFGMRHGQANTFSSGGKTTQYMYNGKELQEDFNLDWYDYGARMYDPALGRFTSIDPLAESYSSNSTYHYALNNPIRYKDFMGMGADEKGKEEEEKKKKEEQRKATEEEMKKFEEAKKKAITIYSAQTQDATYVASDKKLEMALSGLSGDNKTIVRKTIDNARKVNDAVSIYSDFTGKMKGTRKVGGVLNAVSIVENIYSGDYEGAAQDGVMWAASSLSASFSYATLTFQGYAYLASKTEYGASQTLIMARQNLNQRYAMYKNRPTDRNRRLLENASETVKELERNWQQVSKTRK